MSARKPATRGLCHACGVAWPEHDGIMRTCAKLRAARSALKVISTWASCDAEYGTLDADHVLALARKALGESE